MKTFNLQKLLFGLFSLLIVAALFASYQYVPEIGLITPSLAFALPVCPTGCTSSLPDVQFDECNPEVNGAQVAKVYVTNIGYPLTDWTDALEWDARMNPLVPGPSDIKTLHVVGAKPVPTATEKEISLGRKVAGKKTHVLSVKIDETNATNHEFVRKNECGGNYLFWYETLEGLLFGGNTGISGSLLLDMNIAESSEENIVFEGKFEWKSKFTEERIVSPIA